MVFRPDVGSIYMSRPITRRAFRVLAVCRRPEASTLYLKWQRLPGRGKVRWALFRWVPFNLSSGERYKGRESAGGQRSPDPMEDAPMFFDPGAPAKRPIS